MKTFLKTEDFSKKKFVNRLYFGEFLDDFFCVCERSKQTAWVALKNIFIMQIIKTNFLEQKYIFFFVNVARFARKYFSFSKALKS